MIVSFQYAEAHLADLILAASRGEIVEIENNTHFVRIIATPNRVAPNTSGRRIFGAARGEMIVPSEEEWRASDKELESLMNDGPIFPPEL